MSDTRIEKKGAVMSILAVMFRRSVLRPPSMRPLQRLTLAPRIPMSRFSIATESPGVKDDKEGQSESSTVSSDGQKDAEKGEVKDTHKELSARLLDVESQLAKSQAALADRDGQLQELRNSYRVTLADMDNLRVRTKKEVDNAAAFSVSKFAKDLLAVADVLETAIAVLPAQEAGLLNSEASSKLVADDADGARRAVSEFEEGVALTYRELLNIFRRHGIEPLDPLGKRYDPNLHVGLFEVPKEAHMPAPTDGSPSDPVIIKVQKKGYMIKDRVLRPAEVGIAK